MPEEEPVCDCGDEPPDPDPGCCGADTCEETETCCNETTCVLTSSFQTDSNNCGGCGIVCPPGYHCESGTCVSDGGGTMGCCRTYTCTAHPDNPSLPYNFDLTSTVSTNEDCSTGDSTCCFDIPGMHPACVGSTYSIWSSEPCPGCCYNYICDGEGMLTFTGKSPAASSACEDSYCYYNCYGDLACRGQTSNLYYPEETCPSALGAPLNKEIVVSDTPCVDGECEEHVATWMAEPIGEPNEDGLYKVKWILLDDCPGACCSDQPTQPEFVKTSTLIDAPCKCGCN